MKKIVFAIPVVGVVATVVALGVTSIKPWSWSATANKKQINYCLLIGQTDHNDSAARTRGIREALDTRPKEHETNPNIENAKQGELTFVFNDGKEDTYVVNELESKVCISDSGATWDQATSINTCNTWYAKFQNDITMIVSNNDGMAEGALFSSLRPNGMPIFGYDSNESTMKLVRDGRITGTINSNAPAQAAAMNILACRLLSGEHGITGEGTNYNYDGVYNKLFKGFYFSDDIKNQSTQDNDYVSKENGGYLTDITSAKNKVHFKWNPKDHSLLVSSNIVKKDNVSDFLKGHAEQASSINAAKSPIERGKYKFFQSCYSKTDTYLTSTMNPLVSDFREMYNVEDTSLSDMVYGDGNNEDTITNALGDKELYQAYLINMTKTVNADKYIAKIKNKAEKEGKDWKKIPIIFYNRQPTDKNNVVDTTYLLPETNGGKDASGNPLPGNPYVFYVGFDANAGADEQGKMITDWLINQVGADHIKGRE